MSRQVWRDSAGEFKVIFTGKADNLIASYDQLGATVTGPRSAVARLKEEGVTVTRKFAMEA